MIVHRLTSRRFPVCDGEGARLYGGRWNSQGRPVVYTAATQSLAELEILAHSAALADDYIVATIEVPDALSMNRFDWIGAYLSDSLVHVEPYGFGNGIALRMRHHS